MGGSTRKLKEWDSVWAEHCVKMTTNPWTEKALSAKFLELLSVGLNAAQTHVNSDGTRRHMRAAIAAGCALSLRSLWQASTISRCLKTRISDGRRARCLCGKK